MLFGPQGRPKAPPRSLAGAHKELTRTPTSSEGASEENLALLQRLAAAIKTLKIPWVIGGDFNMTPAALRATNWPQVVKGTVVAPAAPTCAQSVYDFSPYPIPSPTRGRRQRHR